MDSKTIFANRLSELSKGKLQQEIATAAGVSRVTISYYQRGERLPDVVTLAKLATYFGVTADYLVGLSDAKQPENSDIVERLGLTEKTINKLLAIKQRHDTAMANGASYDFSELDIMNQLICKICDAYICTSISLLCELLCEGIVNPIMTSSIFETEVDIILSAADSGVSLDDSIDLKELNEIREKAKKYGCRVVGSGEEIDRLKYKINQNMQDAFYSVIHSLDSAFTQAHARRLQEANILSGEPDGDD